MGEKARSVKDLTLEAPVNRSPCENSFGPGFRIIFGHVLPCNLWIDNAYPKMMGSIVREQVVVPWFHFRVIGVMATD